MKRAELEVRLIAATKFFEGAVLDTGWTETDAQDGQALIEFAGRACYQSWTRPNAKTATNEGYINHILEVGHLSVVEHAQATFYITGVSRSLTHELVRHRHFSYSQLSQRFVAVSPEDYEFVLPPALEGREDGVEGLEAFLEATTYLYEHLREGLEEGLNEVEGLTATRRKKMAREAARSILANCTETKIVVTGNLRAWRHFISLRASEHADVEIRRLALAILDKLQREFPNVFGDFTLVANLTGPDEVWATTATEAH